MSKAILFESQLVEHFADTSNSYLYKVEDDGTITCNMCSDFEIHKCEEHDDEILSDETLLFEGSCGEGINFNPITKQLKKV